MYPKVNQNIVIDIKNRDMTCRSIIAEIEKNEILIAFPMDMNAIGLLTKGTEITVVFILGENQYKFQTEIIGRKKDKIALFRITKPQENEIIKIQRRDNFRVNSNLKFLLNEKKLNTINISVGGMLFFCETELQLLEGEVVSGTLVVPNTLNKEAELITFQGQIKRISLIKDPDRKNVALEFTMMEQRDQMKIIQYCFEKQRQMRIKSR
ncbi:MAG: flagellar brake domain-containing protein [Bacillus sp. (in: Bacteria)]|nr:flagellar brake domain-containing protein [Bacillus sp. (in: firmicutes)]